MRKSLLLAFFCFSVMAFSQKVIWREHQKLSWNDFQSVVSNQKDENIAAYTSCGIKYTVLKSKTGKLQIMVQAVFDKSRSWKNPSKVNARILNHEQRHFDIAEAFARKIRKEARQKIHTKADFDRNFKGIFDRIYLQYLEFQKKYDAETRRGVDAGKQKEYDAMISKMLRDLTGYKNS